MAFQIIKINDMKMLNNIIKDIKKAKKSEEVTHVKAATTDWTFLFKKNSIKKFLNKYLKDYHIYEIWGNMYKKGDYAVNHNHIPLFPDARYFNVSGVLFLTDTKTPLNFTDFLKKYVGKKGDLLLFKPDTMHSVDSVLDNERITLSFNGRRKEDYEKEEN